MGPDFLQKKKQPELDPNPVNDHTCPESGQHSIHVQPTPSEFHANIGGGTAQKEWCRCGGGQHTEGANPHIEGASVEEVCHPNTRQTTVSMDKLMPT